MAGRNRSVGILSKLKLLDWIIIITLILAAAVFYKFLHHDQKVIHVTAISYSTIFQTNTLRPGDFEVDSSGKKIAEVKNFESSDIPSIPNTPLLNKLTVMNIDLLVDSNSRSDVLEYKNQPLTVGSQIDFSFNSVTFKTYITEVEGNSIKKTPEMKTLDVIIYNQWPWFADAINKGDFVKDATGKKTIVVLAKEVNPTQVVNTTATGEVMELIGSSKVDISLKLRVRLEDVNGSYIFRGYSNILVGKPISFSLGKTQINNALITNIE